MTLVMIHVYAAFHKALYPYHSRDTNDLDAVLL